MVRVHSVLEYRSYTHNIPHGWLCSVLCWSWTPCHHTHRFRMFVTMHTVHRALVFRTTHLVGSDIKTYIDERYPSTLFLVILRLTRQPLHNRDDTSDLQNRDSTGQLTTVTRHHGLQSSSRVGQRGPARRVLEWVGFQVVHCLRHNSSHSSVTSLPLGLWIKTAIPCWSSRPLW